MTCILSSATYLQSVVNFKESTFFFVQNIKLTSSQEYNNQCYCLGNLLLQFVPERTLSQMAKKRKHLLFIAAISCRHDGLLCVIVTILLRELHGRTGYILYRGCTCTQNDKAFNVVTLVNRYKPESFPKTYSASKRTHFPKCTVNYLITVEQRVLYVVLFCDFIQYK